MRAMKLRHMMVFWVFQEKERETSVSTLHANVRMQKEGMDLQTRKAFIGYQIGQHHDHGIPNPEKSVSQLTHPVCNIFCILK